VAAVVLVFMLVLGTVVLITMGGPRDRSTPAGTPDAPARAEKATAGGDEVHQQWVELPQPTTYVNGVPVGYPRSSVGAIAAAYGYSRIASGLDVEATLRAIEFMADPSGAWFPRQRDELGDGLVAQRTALGLSAVGPTAGASLTITPASYQLLSNGAGQAHVLTLNIVSGIAVDGARTSGTVVLDWALRWIGDRWRVVAPYDGGDHDTLAVAPMTSAARALGWQEASGG
jgi:hypothetical protein